MRLVHSLALFSLFVFLGGCDDDSSDATSANDSGQSATACDYMCTGTGCASKCEGDVVYTCSSDNEWVTGDDCGATWLCCALTLVDGVPQGSHMCSAGSADAGLLGSSCEFYCSGIACNTQCEGDVMYYCPAGGEWILEEDCSASGKRCLLNMIEGGPMGERVCE